MADEYLPTTDRVRAAWRDHRVWWVAVDPDAEFDRWLAAHDAQVRREAKAEALREWAAAMLDRYPEDVFTPPTHEDWDWLGRLVKQHGGVLDRFSAACMRRAAWIAMRDADDYAEEGPDD